MKCNSFEEMKAAVSNEIVSQEEKNKRHNSWESFVKKLKGDIKEIDENPLGKRQGEGEAVYKNEKLLKKEGGIRIPYKDVIDIPKEPKRGLLFQYWKNENGEVFSRTPTDDILKLEVCGKKQNISTADRIKQLQVEIGCLEDEIWTLKLLQLEEAKANENNVETIIPQY